jgi:hypothetical protein
MDEFKPQGTTMDSYSKIERQLFDDFVRFGYKAEVARAIAHTFTQYVLGYLDDRQAFESITKGGATEGVARAVLESFKQAKVTPKSATPGAHFGAPMASGLEAR